MLGPHPSGYSSIRFVHPYHDTFTVIGGLPRHAIVRDPQETGDVAGKRWAPHASPRRPRRPLPLEPVAVVPFTLTYKTLPAFCEFLPIPFGVDTNPELLTLIAFRLLIVSKLALAFSVLTGAPNSVFLASCHFDCLAGAHSPS